MSATIEKVRNELINVRNQIKQPETPKSTKLKLLKREGELEDQLRKNHLPHFYDGRICKYCGYPISHVKHGNQQYHEDCAQLNRQDKNMDYKRDYDRKYKGIENLKPNRRSKRTIGEHINVDFNEEIKFVRREYHRTFNKNPN